MSIEMQALAITAMSIAVLHTLTGPDHYVPFIALSKSRGWSFSKTLGWTICCGLGHVFSSVALALGGAAIGWSVAKMGWLETVRGGIAGWSMLVFGVAYCAWGLFRASQNKTHKHFDMYESGEMYVYEHKHGQTVMPTERHKVTPWVMFIIFLLGPCEPMIPLLYFPAAQNSFSGMIMLISVYTLFTLVTMVGMVVLGFYGISFLKTERLEKYMHAIGGFTLFACGVGMVFWEW